MPIIPFGTGTSLEGHVNAPHGGVSIDVRDMNQVLAVHAEDLDCVVEPGITRKALNEYLRDQGVFFPIDPGADASLGGMAATRCSGTNAVRYGTMKDNVLSLKVVLPNGELMTTARRAKKSSAGYDLTRLMVGSEGTLGVITELTLKLTGIPEAISGGICPFPSVEACCNAAILTIQSGIPVARIELLDALQVRAVNLYSKLTLRETPMLFLEFHGTEAGVAEQSERFGEIARGIRRRAVRMDHAAGGAHQAVGGAPQRGVVDLHAAARRQHDPDRRLRADVAAGRMRHRDPARHRREQADRADRGPCRRRQFPSDAADRHATNPDEVARAKAFNERLVERALAMDGTCTGEHGVGQGKMKYLLAEHGAPALDGDARDQAGARPARHHESGQDRFAWLTRSGRYRSGRYRVGGHRFAAKRRQLRERRLAGMGRACRHIDSLVGGSARSGGDRAREPAPEPSCRRRCWALRSL